MSLPNDVARCSGKQWDPFGVIPECIDCQRRESASTVVNMRRTVWMEPPQQEPCPLRIPPGDE